jgi:hypothetical protein
MPTPAEVLAAAAGFVGDVLGASSLRFEVVATLALLGVVLVLLQLVARPVTRWVATDAGGLGAVGRAMALAAESGTDVVVSLGNAGITRTTDALARLQTVAAHPILGHVVRAAARSGVPLRVLTNDPLAAVIARSTIDAAHAATDTPERSRRSRAVFVGEGRPAAAGLVATTRARPAAAVVAGSLREEAALQLEGLGGTSGSLLGGTAEAAQAANVAVAGATLLGPELHQAAADLRSDVTERTMVMAANRLIAIVVACIVVLTILVLAGIVEAEALRFAVGAE